MQAFRLLLDGKCPAPENHFAYEHRAEEYAELILASWNGGYEQA